MTLTQVWGSLVIFVVCPLLGGLPLISWIVRLLSGRRLSQLGTGNISVSAAFYHGGRLAGILAVLSEALKGIAAVLLARFFFPSDPVWEVIALIALVMGRYWISRGAGTTNVVWGYVVHDWITAGLVFLISGIGFTLFRERRQGRLIVLILLPLIIALRYPTDGARIGATVSLSILLGWIYHKIPDDLDLPSQGAQKMSQSTFQFFRGDRALQSLDRELDATTVGQKAATLSRLKRWGYPVPMGWVLPAGDDPAPFIAAIDPTAEHPVIARSSAIGEDSDQASAAGQYDSFPNLTSQPALEQAILQCQASYNNPGAVQYRQDRKVANSSMAVLVQDQVRSVFSGVAFSRDPITRQGHAVLVEALPGSAQRVVSGEFTPEQYSVWVQETDLPDERRDDPAGWILPDAVALEMEGSGDVPPRLIQQVAYLARHIEARHHGIPQDLEWSYDGHQLWVLQSRPITTLLPIWTRKIAAEVIPGWIRPLTWSVNRPLTCGVWGEIFTVVLGDRAQGLDFNETATLHHSSAYFNASLLGEIFLRMGLPPESLEFLTRGAPFSKPPLGSTVRNLPGLARLARRELRLEQDFEQDDRDRFVPGLKNLADQPVEKLSAVSLLVRIEQILGLLKRATYYSILVPLSVSMRQGIFSVRDADLDHSQAPEIASLKALQELAIASRPLLPQREQLDPHSSSVFAALAENSDGRTVLNQFDRFLEDYGYLSEVATDIAVPRWQEDPQPARELFAQFLLDFAPPPAPSSDQDEDRLQAPEWKLQQVQRRVDLKGRVTAVYSKFLAELRWSVVALEQLWLESGLLSAAGDIFFLEFEEVRQLVDSNGELPLQISQRVAARRSQFEQDQELSVPALVYGNDPPRLRFQEGLKPTQAGGQQLQGIGASAGVSEGNILVLKNFRGTAAITRDTILVVPHTDSGWAPLLARAGGVISEVGGRLSHGAIVAREYGIPAVMDIHGATQWFRDGQRVRIDGERGVIEVLE